MLNKIILFELEEKKLIKINKLKNMDLIALLIFRIK